MPGCKYVAQSASMRDWILANTRLRGSPDGGESKFVITLWFLWKWTCTQVLDPGKRVPHEKGPFLLHKFEEIKSSLSRGNGNSGMNHEPPQDTLVAWSAPPPGWVILNTDGASKGNPGPAGRGGVIRGE